MQATLFSLVALTVAIFILMTGFEMGRESVLDDCREYGAHESGGSANRVRIACAVEAPK
jgi:hypothetical protein